MFTFVSILLNLFFDLIDVIFVGRFVACVIIYFFEFFVIFLT